jgi:prepilin-type N-terminal cleavage/methylation domain-containing protein
MFKKTGNIKGFTLIEVIIIIVILGIISVVVFAKYQDMSIEARRSSCRSSLGSLRSAISVYYANSATTTGEAVWPDIDSLRTVGVVMSISIPPNPFQNEDNAPDSIVLGATKGVTVGSRGGWAYKPSTGEIWPNTSTVIPGSGCSGEQEIGENNW